FAGKLDFGRVGATSATDLPMLWFTGVARKAWMLPRIRPAAHDCHSRDLSAFVDFVSHDCEEVGTSGKQRVEVGHDVVLPDESMGPVELRIEVASHDLALVVDAAGYAAKISRQKAEVCEHAVLPKRAILG